jgi:hypothetical protein
MEVGEPATNITGYFTFITPPSHIGSGADQWTPPVNEDNSLPYGDECSLGDPGGCPSPWSSGGFMWNIPARWRVGDDGKTNSMTGWNQVFSIDGNGTVSIQKFGHGVTRTTNDVITTN